MLYGLHGLRPEKKILCLRLLDMIPFNQCVHDYWSIYADVDNINMGDQAFEFMLGRYITAMSLETAIRAR